MLDIFKDLSTQFGTFSYPEIWWNQQVECWGIPSEQGDFLINMKEWQHATQTS